MPNKPATICNAPGCFTISTGSYCSKHHKKSGNDKKHYNSKRWQRLRRIVLNRDPICVSCQTEAATDVDHIIPLSDGGDDSMDNLQGLCRVCHGRKSARGLNDLFYPHLPKPAIPVIMVCGCPGAGKTSYVREHARPGDVVIDLDLIQDQIAGTSRAQRKPTSDLLIKALQQRNEMLRSLANERDKTAWFVIGAPTATERREWKKQLSARIVMLEVQPDVAELRIAKDADRVGGQYWIRSWWQRYTPDPNIDDHILFIGADDVGHVVQLERGG